MTCWCARCPTVPERRAAFHCAATPSSLSQIARVLHPHATCVAACCSRCDSWELPLGFTPYLTVNCTRNLISFIEHLRGRCMVSWTWTRRNRGGKRGVACSALLPARVHMSFALSIASAAAPAPLSTYSQQMSRPAMERLSLSPTSLSSPPSSAKRSSAQKSHRCPHCTEDISENVNKHFLKTKFNTRHDCKANCTCTGGKWMEQCLWRSVHAPIRATSRTPVPVSHAPVVYARFQNVAS